MRNPFEQAVVAGPHQYRTEWDVRSLNAGPTEELRRVFEKARTADNRELTRIPLILGTPGHGKTHLFGRIMSEFQDETLTIFIPQVEDPQQPMEHFRRSIVESLFRRREGQDQSALERLLANFCHDSFIQCFEAFPASLQSKYHQLGSRLKKDATESLAIVRDVQHSEPFLKLAESIAASPGLQCVDQHLVSALVLGWSSGLGMLARRWLRGELLSTEDLRALGFPATRSDDESPGPAAPSTSELLRAVSVLVGRQPIVLCCDQLEAVLAADGGMENFSNALIQLIQDEDLPNLVIVVGCLYDTWKTRHGNSAQLPMFTDRVIEIPLSEQRLPQAIELIEKRLLSWSGRQADRDPLWPFDQSSLKAWFEKIRPSPRGLISECRLKFNEWLNGSRDELITFGEVAQAIDIKSLWNDELSTVQTDESRGLDNLDKSRFNNAVEELLKVVPKTGDSRPSEWMLDDVQKLDMSTSSVHREGRRLGMVNAAGEKRHAMFFITTTNSKGSYNHHLNAVKKAIEGELDEGTFPLLVHSGRSLPLSPHGQGLYDKLEEEFGLESFLLGEEVETYEEIECFYSLWSQCVTGHLQSGTTTIDADQLMQFAVEDLKLTRHSKLVQKLFGGSGVRSGATAGKVHETAAVLETASVQHTPIGQPAAPATPVVGVDVLVDGPPARTGRVGPAPRGDDGGDERDSDSAFDWADGLLDRVCEELQTFNLKVEARHVEVGPRFARLVIKPHGRTTIAQIRNKAEDLKTRLDGIDNTPMIDSQADGVSVDVGLPSEYRTIVTLDDMQAERPDDYEFRPLFPVGQDVAGRNYWADLSDANHAHFLVAGMTGSGKSEFLKAMMAGLASVLPPERLRFILIDPKRVTFNLPGPSPYLGINGLGSDVIYTASDARPILRWCAEETDRRYEFLQEKGISNLSDARLDDDETPPRLVVFCDEFADLVSDAELKKELDKSLQKMASKARAAGIHLVLATQRPDKDVFNMQIRSNLPGRVCLKVASVNDSKIVLDSGEAADLLGKGDLLWKDGVGKLRLQSPLVTSEELNQALRVSSNGSIPHFSP